jgi:hypothetical protein
MAYTNLNNLNNISPLEINISGMGSASEATSTLISTSQDAVGNILILLNPCMGILQERPKLPIRHYAFNANLCRLVFLYFSGRIAWRDNNNYLSIDLVLNDYLN